MASAHKYRSGDLSISAQYSNWNADNITTLKISCQWPDGKLQDV